MNKAAKRRHLLARWRKHAARCRARRARVALERGIRRALRSLPHRKARPGLIHLLFAWVLAFLRRIGYSSPHGKTSPGYGEND